MLAMCCQLEVVIAGGLGLRVEGYVVTRCSNRHNLWKWFSTLTTPQLAPVVILEAYYREGKGYENTVDFDVVLEKAFGI